MKSFLSWLIIFCVQLVAIQIAQYFGIIQWVWENDATKISFLILAVWLIFSIKIGHQVFKYSKTCLVTESYEKTFNYGWFASDQCLTLGMLGTVIGFLLMMSSISLGTDVSAIQAMLKMMATGMSTALITTAVGMIFGNLLKLQLVIFEREK